MYKNTFFALLSGLFLLNSCTPAQPKNEAALQSIAIDYGYEGIAADDQMGQMMFAKKRYSIYCDANFSVIRSYAVGADQASLDAVVTTVFKDLKTGKIWHGMELGNQKLRVEGSAEDATAGQLFETYVDPAYSLTKVDAPATTIQSYPCEKWHLAQAEMVSPFLFLTTAIQPSDAVKNMPMFISRDGKFQGLCLGNDTPFGDKTYSLRAQKVELNQLQPVAEQLAGFRDSSKEEINRILKELLGF